MMSQVPARVRPSISATSTDQELVALTLAGRSEAFAAIIRRNNQRLFRLARSIVKDDSEAEDILQDSYIRAYVGLVDFRGEARLATWLGRIVTNEALGRLRRSRSRPEHEPLETVVEDSKVLPFTRLPNGPEQNAVNAELRRLLEAEIDRLPNAFRVTFMLREVEQLSVEEVAELLDIPPATVKTRCYRAKLLLREALSEQLDTVLGETFVFLGDRCDRMVARVMQALEAAKLLVDDRSVPSLDT